MYVLGRRKYRADPPTPAEHRRQSHTASNEHTRSELPRDRGHLCISAKTNARFDTAELTLDRSPVSGHPTALASAAARAWRTVSQALVVAGGTPAVAGARCTERQPAVLQPEAFPGAVGHRRRGLDPGPESDLQRDIVVSVGRVVVGFAA